MEVCRISLPRIAIPFGGEDTFAADLPERAAQAADTGKYVDEFEVLGVGVI